jgi:hypothetical protein
MIAEEETKNNVLKEAAHEVPLPSMLLISFLSCLPIKIMSRKVPTRWNNQIKRYDKLICELAFI